MIYQKILKDLQEKGLFEAHRKVLVAVSGGFDSMHLLTFLYEQKTALKIDLGIAHFNHQQRPESDEEEKGLRQLAKELDLPFYVSYFSGKFSEKNAREQRYAFFEKLMLEQGYTALVTAHHADDQAETVLMRLLRGSRLRHLSGIVPVQDLAYGQLIRPFLAYRKQDFPLIFHYEDSSNHSFDFFRNRVRNQYLPTLSQENPQFSRHLLHLADEITLARQALRELTDGTDVTDCASFLGQAPSVQYFLLEDYVAGFSDLQLSKAQFDEVLKIIRQKKDYQHPIKSGYWLVKNKQNFTIKKISPKSYSQDLNKVLNYGDKLDLEGWQLSFGTFEQKEKLVVELSSTASLTIRRRQAGDKINFGTHSKKLRRLFIDDKISQEDREKAVIIEQEGEIYAVLTDEKTYLRKNGKNDIMKAKLYIEKIEEG